MFLWSSSCFSFSIYPLILFDKIEGEGYVCWPKIMWFRRSRGPQKHLNPHQLWTVNAALHPVNCLCTALSVVADPSMVSFLRLRKDRNPVSSVIKHGDGWEPLNGKQIPLNSDPLLAESLKQTDWDTEGQRLRRWEVSIDRNSSIWCYPSSNILKT